MSEVRIRRESPADIAGVHGVLVAAFRTALEARLVDALRDATDPQIALVARLRSSLTMAAGRSATSSLPRLSARQELCPGRIMDAEVG
jgi:hypothetical protein